MSSDGVSSIHDSSSPGGRTSGITIVSKVGVHSDGVNSYGYSLSEPFDIIIEKGYIFPKKNGIFEMKYPDFDIKVSVR
jgi:hypothetical protein